jgi:hypothetical protein
VHDALKPADQAAMGHVDAIEQACLDGLLTGPMFFLMHSKVPL